MMLLPRPGPANSAVVADQPRMPRKAAVSCWPATRANGSVISGGLADKQIAARLHL